MKLDVFGTRPITRNVKLPYPSRIYRMLVSIEIDLAFLLTDPNGLKCKNLKYFVKLDVFGTRLIKRNVEFTYLSRK